MWVAAKSGAGYPDLGSGTGIRTGLGSKSGAAMLGLIAPYRRLALMYGQACYQIHSSFLEVTSLKRESKITPNRSISKFLWLRHYKNAQS